MPPPIINDGGIKMQKFSLYTISLLFKIIRCEDMSRVSIRYWQKEKLVLSCQPRVTVTSGFVYKVIWGSESIDHLCINPIRRIGLIHK